MIHITAILVKKMMLKKLIKKSKIVDFLIFLWSKDTYYLSKYSLMIQCYILHMKDKWVYFYKWILQNISSQINSLIR